MASNTFWGHVKCFHGQYRAGSEYLHISGRTFSPPGVPTEYLWEGFLGPAAVFKFGYTRYRQLWPVEKHVIWAVQLFLVIRILRNT